MKRLKPQVCLPVANPSSWRWYVRVVVFQFDENNVMPPLVYAAKFPVGGHPRILGSTMISLAYGDSSNALTSTVAGDLLDSSLNDDDRRLNPTCICPARGERTRDAIIGTVLITFSYHNREVDVWEKGTESNWTIMNEHVHGRVEAHPNNHTMSTSLWVVPSCALVLGGENLIQRYLDLKNGSVSRLSTPSWLAGVSFCW